MADRMGSTLRVATFNIGDFTGRGFEKGSEEGKQTIRATMASVGATCWALQEDVYDYGNGEEVYTALYSDYAHYTRHGTGEYNYKAFLTNEQLSDVAPVSYTGDMVFRHPWFLRGSLTLGDREICLISLHFDWSDKNVRAEQIRQVIAYADEHPYCIIMGDFNPEDCLDGKKVSHRLWHEEEFARFVAAGYSLANGGAFGSFDTILDTDITPCPFDNIIVSPSIRIERAGRVADPWMCDHALVWADLTLL